VSSQWLIKKSFHGRLLFDGVEGGTLRVRRIGRCLKPATGLWRGHLMRVRVFYPVRSQTDDMFFFQ
jgi:hypothetical protein